jgi:hypothetical protein
LPFVPRSSTSSGWGVEQLDDPVAVAGLDGAVGEDERRRRLGAALKGGDVAAQSGPRIEAVTPGEIALCLGDRDAVHGRNPGGTVLVVLDVRPERLLHVQPDLLP